LPFHGVNVTERLPLKILCLHDLYEINSQNIILFLYLDLSE
jgi:hypothetical protein